MVSHTALRKWRSCETTTNAPANSRRYSSSHWIEAMSRWFVGSSSSSTSGSPKSTCASSTRSRKPPRQLAHRPRVAHVLNTEAGEQRGRLRFRLVPVQLGDR